MAQPPAHHRPSNTVRKFLSGEQVRVWRLAQGYSLGQAAARLGVSPQAVANFEKAGVGRKEALAFAAIIAGLEPYEPSEADVVRARLAEAIGP